MEEDRKLAAVKKMLDNVSNFLLICKAATAAASIAIKLVEKEGLSLHFRCVKRIENTDQCRG